MLYVTFCERVGHFFGQFDRRPASQLREMEEELAVVYGNSCGNPLLYVDGKDHVGGFGVAKWHKDGKFYRVEIIHELFDKEVT